jgi:hypothetical protein
VIEIAISLPPLLPLPEALKPLKAISKAVGLELKGTVMSLDGVYDSKANRKMIFNHGMTPNIPENKRNRKTTFLDPLLMIQSKSCLKCD